MATTYTIFFEHLQIVPLHVRGMTMKQGKSARNLVIFKYLHIITISMKMSCREFFIDMVIHWGIFNLLPPSDAVRKQENSF